MVLPFLRDGDGRGETGGWRAAKREVSKLEPILGVREKREGPENTSLRKLLQHGFGSNPCRWRAAKIRFGSICRRWGRVMGRDLGESGISTAMQRWVGRFQAGGRPGSWPGFRRNRSAARGPHQRIRRRTTVVAHVHGPHPWPRIGGGGPLSPGSLLRQRMSGQLWQSRTSGRSRRLILLRRSRIPSARRDLRQAVASFRRRLPGRRRDS